MDYDTISSLQMNRWHRIYLNAYWCMIVLSLAVACVGYPFRSVSEESALYPCILFPTAGLSAVAIVAELTLPRMKAYQDFFMITTATAMCAVLVSSISMITFIQSLFVLPLLISVIYMRRQIAFYAFGLNLSCFYVTTFANEAIRVQTTRDQIILIHLLLVAVLLIALTIVARGRQLARYLQSVIDAKQELLVQNVVLDKLIKTDALTGLYNHRTFHEYLDKLLELWNHQPFPLCLAVLDIDNFKTVNDTYGHRAGDIVLRAVATAIQEALTPNDFAARYGGEEFAVIMTEKSFKEAYAMLEDIRTVIANMRHPELDGSSVTVSIGLYAHRANEDKERLFEKADMLLYEAKHSGKNRTACAG
ncbi:GGDEF domain-containing protein [Paenibacillus validus]|nr:MULTISPECIES: GGDEF domain-containing protein [Paenibacillus]MED4603962.1 GGDEF domain-containing protein [Paenibacillus validus]MED4609815.1 GGDEF domain-containing protein [Paenibacillus validus]